jgi:hypothetical protein
MATCKFSTTEAMNLLGRIFVLKCNIQKLPDSSGYRFPRGTICRAASVALSNQENRLRIVLRELQTDLEVGSFMKGGIKKRAKLYSPPVAENAYDQRFKIELTPQRDAATGNRARSLENG